MSNKSYRIRTKINGGDNVVKVNLKRGVKTLNILSLEINPEDAYEKQTSDYGVIVGRVLANDAFGVPNVKVSVFIPLDGSDEEDYIISNEYPFKTPQTKDINGVRYNVLPQKKDAIGTFPSKRMVLDNDGCIEVFDKYWKYTTTTNNSGDYMIFGVPTGNCQVHYDCDLSDVGIISQHPYDFIAKGYDENLFKSKTKFTDEDLNTAIHIISRDMTTYVYPFWGDKDENKIGITRNDINIDYKFEPSCIFMGSSITDPDGTYISIDGKPNGSNGTFGSLSTSIGDIEVIRKTYDGKVEELKDNVKGIIDANGVWCYQIPMNLDRIGTDEYGNTISINDPNKGIPTRARVRFRVSLSNNTSSGGVTAKMLVPCNPELEYGSTTSNEPLPKGSNEINSTNETVNNNSSSTGGGRSRLSTNSSSGRSSGITTSGSGLGQIDASTDDYNAPPDYENIYEFGSKTPDAHFRDLYWGKVYSVKQYYPRFHYDDNPHSVYCFVGQEDWFDKWEDLLFKAGSSWDSASSEMYDYRGFPVIYKYSQSCVSSTEPTFGLNSFPYTTLYAGPEVSIDYSVGYWFYYHFTEDSSDESLTDKGLHFCFENDWVNGCLYFPRFELKMNGSYYDYFGYKSDVHKESRSWRSSDIGYSNVYISGRHNFYWDDISKKFTARYRGRTDRYLSFAGVDAKDDYGYYDSGGVDLTWISQNAISTFTRSGLKSGIITKKTTIIGEDVFYYRCGGVQYNSARGTSSNSYRMLYSTDIILLGNLEDIYDHLPKLYKNLPPTSAIFPPIGTNTEMKESGMSKQCYHNQISGSESDDIDTELMDIFGFYTEPGWTGYSKTDSCKYSTLEQAYSGDFKKNLLDCVKESFRKYRKPFFLVMEALMRRVSLFFNVTINDVDDVLVFDVPAFVNSSRLCELDVHNDMAFYDDSGFAIPTNGMIDVYDIATNENRSTFASMNYDINKYVLDSLGNRRFVATPIVINGFDGRLYEYINNSNVMDFTLNNKKLANDNVDNSYMAFRFGYYDGWRGPFLQSETNIGNRGDIVNYANGPLYLPQNSFYFYFGLRSGHSALDVLNDKYIGNDELDSVVTNSASISILQNNKIMCDEDNGNQLGSVTIRTSNISYPISWQVYQGAFSISAGQTSDNEFDIDELVAGRNYRLEIVDSSNNTYSNDFYVDKESISTEISPTDNPFIDKRELIISSINDDYIYHVSGSNVTSESESGGCTGEDYYLSGGSGNVLDVFQNNKTPESVSTADMKIRLIFDSNFEYWYTTEVDGVNDAKVLHIIFQNSVDELKITSKVMRFYCGDVDFKESCFVSETTCRFQPYINAELTLSNIPVKYFNGWGPFAYWEKSSIDMPDSEFEPNTSQEENEFNLFDSINVAHPDQTTIKWNWGYGISSLNRGFNFIDNDTNEPIDYLTQLGYVSLMSSSVFGRNDMNLVDNSESSGYNEISISPNFTRTEYMPSENFVIKWDDGIFESDDMEVQVASIDGQVVAKQQLPHIVGSNYPLSAYTYPYPYDSETNGDEVESGYTITMLKCNDEDFVVGYKNNKNLTVKDEYLNDFYFGINYFGCSNENHENDKPMTLTPPISAHTYTKLGPRDIKNYFAARTVDKRLDYRFAGVTPLLMPSGYDLFPNLENKTIVPGKIDIDLYGGFRLNYVGSGDTRNLTSYTTKGNEMSRKFFGWDYDTKDMWFRNVVGNSFVEQYNSLQSDNEKLEFVEELKENASRAYIIEYNLLPSGYSEKNWVKKNGAKWLLSEFEGINDMRDKINWILSFSGGGYTNTDYNTLTEDDKKSFVMGEYDSLTKRDGIKYFLQDKAWEEYCNLNEDEKEEWALEHNIQIYDYTYEKPIIRKYYGDELLRRYDLSINKSDIIDGFDEENWEIYAQSGWVYEKCSEWAKLDYFENEYQNSGFEFDEYFGYKHDETYGSENIFNEYLNSDGYEWVLNKHYHYIETMINCLPQRNLYEYVYINSNNSNDFHNFFNNMDWASYRLDSSQPYENINKVINFLQSQYNLNTTYNSRVRFIENNLPISSITEYIDGSEVDVTILDKFKEYVINGQIEWLNNISETESLFDNREGNEIITSNELNEVLNENEIVEIEISGETYGIEMFVSLFLQETENIQKNWQLTNIINNTQMFYSFKEYMATKTISWVSENIDDFDGEFEFDNRREYIYRKLGLINNHGNITSPYHDVVKEFDDYFYQEQYNWIKKYGGVQISNGFVNFFQEEQKNKLKEEANTDYVCYPFFGWDDDTKQSWISENELLYSYQSMDEDSLNNLVTGSSTTLQNWALEKYNSLETKREKEVWIINKVKTYIANEYNSLSSEDDIEEFILENSGRWELVNFSKLPQSEQSEYIKDKSASRFADEFESWNENNKKTWLQDNIGAYKYEEFIALNRSYWENWLNNNFRDLIDELQYPGNREPYGIFTGTTGLKKYYLVWCWCRDWAVAQYESLSGDTEQIKDFVGVYYGKILTKEFLGFTDNEKNNWLKRVARENITKEYLNWDVNDAKKYLIEICDGDYNYLESLETESARQYYINGLPGRYMYLWQRDDDSTWKLYDEFSSITPENCGKYFVAKTFGELSQKEYDSITYEYTRKKWFVDVSGGTEVAQCDNINQWIANVGETPENIPNKENWVKNYVGNDTYLVYINTKKESDIHDMVDNISSAWSETVFTEYNDESQHNWVFNNVSAATSEISLRFANYFSGFTGDTMDDFEGNVSPSPIGKTKNEWVALAQSQKFFASTDNDARYYWLSERFGYNYRHQIEDGWTDVYNISGKLAMADFTKIIDYEEDGNLGNAKQYVSKRLLEDYGIDWDYFNNNLREREAILNNSGIYEIYNSINGGLTEFDDLKEIYINIISGDLGLRFYDVLNDNEKSSYVYENGGGDLICGGPQRNETIQGRGDGADLFSKSFTEDGNDINNAHISEDKINVWDMTYDYVQLYHEIIQAYAMPVDVDHVKYSINRLSAGTSNFNANFVDCNTYFGDGLVTAGQSENLSISYKPGVKIIRNVSLDNIEPYDITYDMTNVAYSATPSSRTEVFASLEGSSLSFTLNGDNEWGGDTFTDSMILGERPGDFYPDWASPSSGDAFDAKSHELSICWCGLSIASQTGKYQILLYNEFNLTGSGECHLADEKCISLYNEVELESGGTIIKSVSDKESLEKGNRFNLGPIQQDLDNAHGSYTFLMIPTKRVYSDLSSNTLLKQGVIYNRGYSYFTGSMSCVLSNDSNLMKIRINTPLRDMYGKINYNVKQLLYHNIGKIEEGSIKCDNEDVSVTYNADDMEFFVRRNNESVTTTSVYFSIENGLKYRMLISFTPNQ